MTDPAIDDATAAILPDALDLSHRVHANPEIAFQEVQASQWTAELLDRHGFDVTAPAGGLDTAFVARWAGDRPGPVIAYAGEYDALPEVGHGCGHNLMCSSSAGAAVAATRVLGRDFGGEIRFIGTPAEEAGNGKVHLIAAGLFGDVDVCLQIHPSDSNSAEVLALAITEVKVAFHGKLAHASGDPWLGKNALDAIVLLYTMVAQWRQHLKHGERVHGIITHGGAAPNIVPDLTTGRWYLRTPVEEDLDAMIERFRTMADAAALATGCTVELTIDPMNRCRTMVNNPTLLEIWRRHLADAGIADDPIDPNAGSTDMANVSHEVPTIHPYLAIAPRGTPGHSREFAEHAGGADGDRVLADAIRILAATGVELIRNPESVEAAWRELREAGGGRGGASGLSDILAGHGSDEALLAELYDLEHDAITEDLAFYREWARRTHGATIDLGCGSGRLFTELLRGRGSEGRRHRWLGGTAGSGARPHRCRRAAECGARRRSHRARAGGRPDGPPPASVQAGDHGGRARAPRRSGGCGAGAGRRKTAAPAEGKAHRGHAWAERITRARPPALHRLGARARRSACRPAQSARARRGPGRPPRGVLRHSPT